MDNTNDQMLADNEHDLEVGGSSKKKRGSRI